MTKAGKIKDQLPTPRLREKAAGVVYEALGTKKKPQTMGANAPFLIDDSDRAWLVLNGSIDIFYLRDGSVESAKGIHGIRHQIVHLDKGDGLIGFAGIKSSHRILAVPSNGAEIFETTRSKILKLGNKGGKIAAAVEELIDVWIYQLIHGIGSSRPPRDSKPLTHGGDYEFGQGTAIQGMDRPIWIDIDKIEGGYNDIVPIESKSSGGRFLPLTHDSWLRLDKDIKCHPILTGAWFEKGDPIADLDFFNQIALEVVNKTIARIAEEHEERVNLKQRFGQQVFNTALRAMVGVLDKAQRIFLDISGDPLSVACEMVAGASGIKVKLPKGGESDLRKLKDPVQSIGRSSGFHVRQVSLSGEWWTSDHGPLLAFYGAEKKPCALLPISPHMYRLVDSETGIDEIVTPKIAATIDQEAFYFFRPFPRGNLTAKDIFLFSLRGGKREMWLVAGMIVLSGLLSLVTPVVTGWIMDPIIPEAMLNQLTVLVLALIIVGISASGFSLVQSITMLRLEGMMDNSVQAAVWDRLLKLPASFFRKFTVGDLTNRADGIDAMRQLLTSSVTATLLHTVVGVFSLILMFYYDWHLTLITGIIVIIYGIFTYFFGRKILSRNRDLMALVGRIQGIVLQLLGTVSKIRVTGSERSAFSQWSRPYAEMMSINYDQANISNWLTVCHVVFSYIAVIGILAVIGWEGDILFDLFKTPSDWDAITSDKVQTFMPTGKFVAFHVAFGQFLAAVFGFAGVAIQLVNLKPLYERVEPILLEVEETDDSAADPGELSGAIEIKNVNFRYSPDGPLVLKGLSLKAQPGQFIAIVGPSGAGKSSLVRLLLGFDKAESGAIFFDDLDLNGLNKRAVRRNFGVVLQNGKLLSGSIYNNIASGANITRDEVWEAARLAGLDKDIEAMPMGMETFVSEGGATFSGGQCQRLMIARAVARKPRIIIFDEATSALDNETQEIVSKGLETLNSTRVVIAHRLSTIINADIIYVVVAGVVVEEGTYQELMEKDGVFAELAKRQLA
ncbi:MAG: NHLP bacteriocin export ABC transporter permease/ATPase subunit [Rhodospirillaceae bacterium]|jgi:NHLM bacteriocin system ABC transporter ATP-binding protein|nr:NHLP bacteriocin export ABC transporter permease/ATPase subunit [Rhodospirillaceae bacterium]MBT5374462.1 NHLP bacteriocin export ABC transporter permease/ATPase subunit [Rhodospirillaceae bacterium]MBT5751275.1 NHLP bacteriocin export ABC transporter permease/ATPase subunit [Rhodospirillaceae bacterium]